MPPVPHRDGQVSWHEIICQQHGCVFLQCESQNTVHRTRGPRKARIQLKEGIQRAPAVEQRYPFGSGHTKALETGKGESKTEGTNENAKGVSGVPGAWRVGGVWADSRHGVLPDLQKAQPESSVKGMTSHDASLCGVSNFCWGSHTLSINLHLASY